MKPVAFIMFALVAPLVGHRAVAQPTAAAPAPAAAAPAQPPGPWAGLTVGLVPEALASQLGWAVQPAGRVSAVMVLNLVTDGPADRAGLLRYDVITHLGDRPVPGDAAQFAAMMRQHQPGATVSLRLVRGGQTRSVQLQLAATGPDVRAATYKYPQDAVTVGIDRVEVAGGVWKRGPAGEWQWERFDGAGGALAELPPDIRAQLLSRLRIDPHRDLTLKISQSGDGQSLQIEQERSGRITVRRTKTPPAGEPAAATQPAGQVYAGSDELRLGDSQAFEVYQKAQTPRPRQSWPSASADTMLYGKAQTTRPWPTPLVGSGRATAPSADGVAGGSAAGAVVVTAPGTTGALAPLPEGLWVALTDPAPAQPSAGAPGPSSDAASYEFKTDGPPGGPSRIEVKITRAGNTLILVFTSEEQLKKLAPRVYEQYRKLREGVE